jgi:hypothetical protein
MEFNWVPPAAPPVVGVASLVLLAGVSVAAASAAVFVGATTGVFVGVSVPQAASIGMVITTSAAIHANLDLKRNITVSSSGNVTFINVFLKKRSYGAC